MRTAAGITHTTIQQTPTYSQPEIVTVLAEERNLSDVAKRLNVTVQALLNANPQIADPQSIKPGQAINIPHEADNADIVDQQTIPPRAKSNSDSRLAELSLQGQLQQMRFRNVEDNGKTGRGREEVGNQNQGGTTSPNANSEPMFRNPGPGSKTNRSERAADVKFQNPVPLPGQMMTVTLFDEKGQVITSRTEPLYDHVQKDIFYGEMNGNRIAWQDNADVKAKVGVQLDKEGKPKGGISVDRWAQEAGKGRTRYVLIEVESATLRETKPEEAETLPGFTTDEELGLKPRKKSQGNSNPGKQTDAATTNKSTDNKKPSETHGPKQEGEASTKGDSSETHEGKDGSVRGPKGTAKDGAPTGGIKGSKHGSGGSHGKGSVRGKKDGEDRPEHYFDNPEHAVKGGDANRTHKDGRKEGMAGGEGAKNKGVPDGGFIAEKIPVPRSVAPIVAAAIILNDASITDIAEDMVKMSFKLGPKAKDVLGTVVSNKMKRYVDAEYEKAIDWATKEGKFANKTTLEQDQLKREIREGIEEVANDRLAAELDRQIKDWQDTARQAAKDTSKYAEDNQDLALDWADAAQRAKASLPERPVHPDAPGPDKVLKDDRILPQKFNPSNTPRAAWLDGNNGVPRDLREEVGTILNEIVKRDAVALNKRHPHNLAGDLTGWISLDIKGRQNSYRLLYKQNSKGEIEWMVKDTHGGGYTQK